MQCHVHARTSPTVRDGSCSCSDQVPPGLIAYKLMVKYNVMYGIYGTRCQQLMTSHEDQVVSAGGTPSLVEVSKRPAEPDVFHGKKYACMALADIMFVVNTLLDGT